MAEAGFDLDGLAAAVAAHGPVARVVIAAHDGSSPREVGAAMLVWAEGSSGTIGGGALEWAALTRARAMTGGARLDREALGPGLGQCCGGAVTLLTEVFDAAALAALAGAGVVARPLPSAPGTGDGASGGDIFAKMNKDGVMPLGVARVLAQARASGVLPQAGIVQGWMVEPVARAERQVWVWGAGHVGRAIVGVLAPLPGLAMTWVDVAADRFPEAMPHGVTPVWAGDPAALVAHAPTGAEHLVLTYSHALDLELCHRLLGHEFASLGLIGSRTKWARFRGRLRSLGHAEASISRIVCPIGDPALGKHPQAIAIGVAAQLWSARRPAGKEIAI